MKKPKDNRRRKGFERASGLLQGNIRKVSESRGFAVSRLLTHWAEIVGEDTANVALPVNIRYGRGAFGATLTVLTNGSNAPMLQAGLPKIKDKVNACYGYAAISRINITQTAPIGFSEGQVEFESKNSTEPPEKNPEIVSRVQKSTTEVVNGDLRRALEALGENVLSQPK